ncbi:uncharacterized protein LOC110692547 [Chenopodium quinoa]|uniref:uncharacterized protein LOC110692547 n=1 Tax=Chenopodium quinoa TaxID=63459 RepID=UPI000B787129|nr:uncharacterized protein LOC110692547 [Chenopodium quinoa]
MVGNTPPPSKIEPNSPFYLGSQDRPGDFITPTRLKGDNYDDWAADIRMALEARRKFEFLDGTIIGPTPPCTQSDWNTINAMLVSWITNTIDPEVKSTLTKYRELKKLWDHLQQRFALVNGPRIHHLKSSIARCEHTKSMSVSTYYGQLNALWEELYRHEPLIVCSCCSHCNAGELHARRQEMARLHEFLMGLYSEYYTQLRANILSQDPLTSIDRAYQLAVQDERVRLAKVVLEDKPSEAVGFALNANNGAGRGRGKGNDRQVCSKCQRSGHDASSCWGLPVCTHCKKRGHDVSGCYEIHGYPEGWFDRPKSDGAGRSRVSTQGRGRGSVRANAASSSNVGGSTTGSNTSESSSSNQIFTPDQWKAIAGFFGNTKVPDNRLNGKFNSTRWIIDTCATHYVTGDETWLFDVTDIIHCPVGLPNGGTVLAKKEGSIRLSASITLNHDQTGMLIGTGIRQDGLYYFGEVDSMQHVTANGANSSMELWHKRMGHPSENVVKLLPPVVDFKGNLNKNCEVCFRAKHLRDKFPSSDNRASRIFEKLHCDLWGAYRHPSSCGARYFLTIVDDFSRVVWVYLLDDKTEVFHTFMNFIAMVDRQFFSNDKSCSE